ncbi:FkbM family methyltransferase, partial [Alphaproteobacteria bacterium]|nr:FkbM family methyltransferase [Alphaproteobacteria bacterium]
FRGYQANFDQIMIKSFKKEDVFWDIGSNQGEIVKNAKLSLGDNIYCIAFEPHPILSANLKKLGLEKCQVINAALSNYVGEAKFTYGSDPLQTTGRLDDELSKMDQTKVKVVDLQYCLKVLNLKKPNIMKIDVEGHEYEVLSSILLNIAELKNLRAIFVEIHMSVLDKRKLTFEMNKLIEKFEIETNFKLNWIDVSHFTLER